jgi:hypothetical protein
MVKFARKVLVPGSLLLWTASLAFVAIETRTQSVLGLSLLISGAFGPLVGEIAWYANPAYFLALHWARRQNLSMAQLAAVVAAPLALVPLFSSRIYLNEGFSTSITGYGPGYVLWLSAILIGASAVLISTPLRHPTRETV